MLEGKTFFGKKSCTFNINVSFQKTKYVYLEIALIKNILKAQGRPKEIYIQELDKIRLPCQQIG